MTVNVDARDAAEDIQQLVRSRKPVESGRLADSQMPLGDLVATH